MFNQSKVRTFTSGSPYKCSECGKYSSLITATPYCQICKRQICPDCTHGGLCTTHFNQLSPTDQMEMERIDRDKSKMNKAPCVALLSLFMIPFGLTPIFAGDLDFGVWFGIMMGGIFGTMFLIIVSVVVVSMNYQKRQRKNQQFLADLLNRYQFTPMTGGLFGSNMPMRYSSIAAMNKTLFPDNPFVQPATAPNVQSTKTQFPNQNNSDVTVKPSEEFGFIGKVSIPEDEPKAKERICGGCGYTNKDTNAKFCNYCGRKL